MSQKNKKNTNGCEIKSNVTVVLKVDLHCDGCTHKVLRCIRSYEGVEAANVGEAQKITIVGKIDPLKILERVEKKTRRKVELISPKPNKNADKENAKGKENPKNKGNSGSDDVGKPEKKENESKETKKNNESDEKKPKNNKKEPPVTTAVLKLQLHCEGCTQKIRKIITKAKGYQEMKIDKQKELVTVTAASDMKALAESLKKHLKRNVEIVPQKAKEGEKKENKNGEKKENDGDGGKKENDGDGGKKENKGKKGKEGCENCDGGGGEKKEQAAAYPNPMIMYGSGGNVDHHQQQQFYYSYNPYLNGCVHAPQLFSDENPNACSVM